MPADRPLPPGAAPGAEGFRGSTVFRAERSGLIVVSSRQKDRAAELRESPLERRVEFSPIRGVPGVAGVITAEDGRGRRLGGTRIATVNDLLEREQTASRESVGEARNRAAAIELPTDIDLSRDALTAGVVEAMILAKGMRNKWQGTGVTMDLTMEGAPYVYPQEIRDHYASWRDAAELAGCKSVVIVTDPDAYAEMDPATRYVFARQLGEHTNRINSRNGAVLDERTAEEGSYIAPDSGTDRDDMTVIGATTSWVSSNSPRFGGSDEPSPTTAVGGVHGINAALKVLHLDGDHTSFAIKGAVGAVASDMARILRSQYPGAELILADRPSLTGKTKRLAEELGGPVRVVHSEQIIGMGDVYIPGAMGADLTEDNLDRFVAGGVRIVNGPANGQFPLGREDLMDKYFASGILAVPDYIVNQGGIGQCMQPFVVRNLMAEGLSRREAVVLAGSEMMKARVADIGPVTEYMVKQAIDRGVAPDRVAAEMILEAEARRYIRQGIIPANM